MTENVQAAELLVTWHTVDSHAEHYGVRLETVCDFMWIIRPGDWYYAYYPEEGLDGYRSVELLIQNI